MLCVRYFLCINTCRLVIQMFIIFGKWICSVLISGCGWAVHHQTELRVHWEWVRWNSLFGNSRMSPWKVWSNLNLADWKLYNIICSLFGSVEKVPFSKSTLRNICGRLVMSRQMMMWGQLWLFSPILLLVTHTLHVELLKPEQDQEFDVDKWEQSHAVPVIWWCSHFWHDAQDESVRHAIRAFVGVNNHFQCIILVGVLMRDKQIESFKWAFTKFLSMIGGRAPKTILTGS